QPSLLNQGAVAIVGDLCEISAGLRLLQRRLVLGQRSLSLCNLVIEFGRPDLRQQIARLHMIADIDLARLDVAVGASENIGRRERKGRARQADGRLAAGSVRLGYGNGRDKVPLLLGSRHDLALLRIVSPRAQRKAAGEEQKSTKREHPPAPSVARFSAMLWRLLGVAAESRFVQPILGDRVVSIEDPNLIHWADPRTRHRLRPRRCACAAWQTD